MFRCVLILTLFCAHLSTRAQELFIRAPRISNWDLRTGALTDVAYWITPGATFIQIDADFTISAAGTSFSTADTLEAVLNFNLPDQSIVTDSWLWIGNEIIKARIQDRWTAEDQFEEIVMRNLDPSILTRGFNQQYELKVFPMTIDWDRKVRISFVLPAVLHEGRLSSQVQNSILPSNQITDDKIKIHVRGVGGFGKARIGENQEISAEPGAIGTMEISKDALGQQISFAASDVPYLLQTFAYEGQKYYGLNVDETHFSKNVSGVNKSLFIFDYSLSNNIETLDEICDALVSQIDTSFAASEQLALYIESDQVLDWTAASFDGITAFSAKIRESDGFSNLPEALIAGIEYGHQLEAQQIFFVSNSSPDWNADQISTALQWARDANEANLPIHVISYQNTNWSFHSLNGLQFANNDFFLENLAEISGGGFAKATRETPIASEAFAQVKTRGRLVRRTVDVDVPSGLAYENEENNGRHFGKYFGDDDFEVTILDITHQKIDTMIQLKPNVAGVDYAIFQQWAGLQIEEMSNSLNGGYYYYEFDERIFDIIDLSLASRVLSSYTAFLALEPALGGKICTSCQTEDPGGQISQDFVFNSLGTEMTTSDDNSLTPAEEIQLEPFQLDISPNPAAERVQIGINRTSPIGNILITVYDLMGKRIYHTEVNHRGTVDIDVSGFDSGIYFLQCQVDGEQLTRKLIVQRG